jgi:hypothetical protein
LKLHDVRLSFQGCLLSLLDLQDQSFLKFLGGFVL